MRVIVTGGTGLLGRALSIEMAGRGHEVIVLSRDPSRAADRLPAGVRAERWDARSAAGWGGLVDGHTAIVNLAGESIGGRWTAEGKARIRGSRLDAARAVAEAVRDAAEPPAVVVQQGGVGYYGPRGSEPLTEDAPAGTDFAARVVADAEAAIAPVAEIGTRLVLTRTAVVLAREADALRRLLLPFRLFAGGPLGSGRQIFPWIHVADQTAAMRMFVEDERARGAFNVIAPGAVTNAEFARTAGRVLGRPSFLPTPAPAIRLLLGDQATIVLDGQRPVPDRLTALGFTFRYPELEGALLDVAGSGASGPVAG